MKRSFAKLVAVALVAFAMTMTLGIVVYAWHGYVTGWATHYTLIDYFKSLVTDYYLYNESSYYVQLHESSQHIDNTGGTMVAEGRCDVWDATGLARRVTRIGINVYPGQYHIEQYYLKDRFYQKAPCVRVDTYAGYCGLAFTGGWSVWFCNDGSIHKGSW